MTGVQTCALPISTGGTYTRVDGTTRSYIFSLTGGITGGHATIDSSTGVVSIDSTTPVGTYTETITVTDALNATGTQTFTVKVNSALTETGTAVMVTTFGRARTYNDLTVTGGTATDTFTAGVQKDNTASGGTRALIFSLNTNSDTITINSATGALTIDSSTPAGTYNRTIIVTDSVSATASMNITIYVNPAIVITSNDTVTYTTTGKQGKTNAPVIDNTTGTTSNTHGTGSFSFKFASGSDTQTGKITIDTSTGIVTVDTSTSSGTYYETITVSDSVSATAQFVLKVVVNGSVTISAIPNVVTTWTIPETVTGTSYTVTQGTVLGTGGT